MALIRLGWQKWPRQTAVPTLLARPRIEPEIGHRNGRDTQVALISPHVQILYGLIISPFIRFVQWKEGITVKKFHWSQGTFGTFRADGQQSHTLSSTNHRMMAHRPSSITRMRTFGTAGEWSLGMGTVQHNLRLLAAIFRKSAGSSLELGRRPEVEGLSVCLLNRSRRSDQNARHSSVRA